MPPTDRASAASKRGFRGLPITGAASTTSPQTRGGLLYATAAWRAAIPHPLLDEPVELDAARLRSVEAQVEHRSVEGDDRLPACFVQAVGGEFVSESRHGCASKKVRYRFAVSLGGHSTPCVGTLNSAFGRI